MEDMYKPPESNLVNENVEKDIEYGGFWVRFLASLVDSVWVLALTLTLGWAIYGAIYFESTEVVMGTADVLITYILPLVITISFWIYKAATPGKMVMGLKIVDAHTLGKASGGKLVLRYIGYYLSLIPFGLGYLWVAWDKRKQGWHDKIAGTLVIKTR